MVNGILLKSKETEETYLHYEVVEIVKNFLRYYRESRWNLYQRT